MKQPGAYDFLKGKPTTGPGAHWRGVGRNDLSPDRYATLNRSPHEILMDKKISGPKKVSELVAHASKNGPIKPTKKMVKALRKLNVGGMDAKKLNLRVLGADVVRNINWVGADLSGQNFSYMNLDRININSAKVYDTNFQGSSMRSAQMKELKTGGKVGTIFTDVKAEGAIIEGMKGLAYVKNMADSGQKGLTNNATVIGRTSTSDELHAAPTNKTLAVKNANTTGMAVRPDMAPARKRAPAAAFHL